MKLKPNGKKGYKIGMCVSRTVVVITWDDTVRNEEELR